MSCPDGALYTGPLKSPSAVRFTKQCPVSFELIVEPLKWLWEITDAYAIDLRMIAHGRTEQEAVKILNWLGPAVAKALAELEPKAAP
ncbi:hypothetical protein ABIB82_004061 [Bradyrhizobium sp. i1.8.4]